jgi:hypothetical protein
LKPTLPRLDEAARAVDAAHDFTSAQKRASDRALALIGSECIRADVGYTWSMESNSLSSVEAAIVAQVLRAAADGPFFPDWEFHTLFGLERSEVRAIADAWPEPTASSEEVDRAVDNSLNNLLGYAHKKDSVWSEWISVDRHQLEELFHRLRRLRDKS